MHSWDSGGKVMLPVRMMMPAALAALPTSRMIMSTATLKPAVVMVTALQTGQRLRAALLKLGDASQIAKAVKQIMMQDQVVSTGRQLLMTAILQASVEWILRKQKGTSGSSFPSFLQSAEAWSAS